MAIAITAGTKPRRHLIRQFFESALSTPGHCVHQLDNLRPRTYLCRRGWREIFEAAGLVQRGPNHLVSPQFFCTGTLSPVTMASSGVDAPSTIWPSTGIFLPRAHQNHVRPAPPQQWECSYSRPSRITRAVLACKPISCEWPRKFGPLARFSSRRPSQNQGNNYRSGLKIHIWVQPLVNEPLGIDSGKQANKETRCRCPTATRYPCWPNGA